MYIYTATAATVPRILLQCWINPRRRKGEPHASASHRPHRGTGAVHLELQAPAIVVARGTPPARSLCEPEHTILPPGVRWASSPPARSVTGTRGVARIPVRRRQLWPVLFCRLIVAWTRGGPVELAGGAYRGFGTLGDGHAMRGAVAGRSPPARPAVASVHTLSSGCAPSQTFNQNMLEQHKGSQTFNDFRHTEQAAKSSPTRKL